MNETMDGPMNPRANPGGMHPGSRLFYVVGPSGAGKDTLIAAALGLLPRGVTVRLARRAITRPASGQGEAHEPMSREAWDAVRAAGGFALAWEANGHAYGVRRELDGWLAAGERVIVNGSREYLPHARNRYPALRVLLITAPREQIIERLIARGREAEAEIDARLSRASLIALPHGVRAETIVNDGPVSHAAARLAAILAAD